MFPVSDVIVLCCFFRCVYYLDNMAQYIFFCFLLRMCAAVSTCFAATASFALTVESFDEYAMSVIGLLEISIGVGLSIGPAIGAALYDVSHAGKVSAAPAHEFLNFPCFFTARGICSSVLYTWGIYDATRAVQHVLSGATCFR